MIRRLTLAILVGCVLAGGCILAAAPALACANLYHSGR